MRAEILNDLAALFIYPQGTDTCSLRELASDLAHVGAEAGAAINEFMCAAMDLSVEQQQEQFVQTFDLNPLCCLEVGWQLFGEHYERGRFLVQMRETLRTLGLTESTELPDHLSHVLEALARMPPGEAEVFAARQVLPAVEKMYACLSQTDNMYRHLLQATRAVVAMIASQARQEVQQ